LTATACQALNSSSSLKGGVKPPAAFAIVVVLSTQDEQILSYSLLRVTFKSFNLFFWLFRFCGLVPHDLVPHVQN
jgi:hypothetical protein